LKEKKLEGEENFEDQATQALSPSPQQMAVHIYQARREKDGWRFHLLFKSLRCSRHSGRKHDKPPAPVAGKVLQKQ
jgi:hypothetical protein